MNGLPQARYLTKLVIATDDDRIYSAAREFGGSVRMTRSDHMSGTDRAAEIASAEQAEIVVNIQGDEPMIDPDAIDAAVLAMIEDEEVPMATLKKLIEDPGEVANPNVVKVVTDLAGNAIYFSRCPIPFVRGGTHAHYKTYRSLHLPARFSATLFRSPPWSARTGGMSGTVAGARKTDFGIRVVETDYDSLGVDTPEDLERVSTLFEASLLR